MIGGEEYLRLYSEQQRLVIPSSAKQLFEQLPRASSHATSNRGAGLRFVLYLLRYLTAL